MTTELKPGYKQTEVGVIPEEWEVRKIKSVCKLINGRGFKPFEWAKSGLPIIRIQNLNGSDDFNFYQGDYDKKLEIDSGQLLFAWSGSRGTSFGPHVWSGPRGLLNYHTWKVQVSDSEIDGDFFCHALKKLTAFIEDKAHGASALVHTQKWEMESFEFPFPPTKAEQHAIATALSDVDALLAILDQLIAKKRDLKQATMQQLLTGKKRLPGFEQKKGYKQTEVGMIPEDWNIIRLSSLISLPIQNGVFNEPGRKGHGCKLINVIDLYSAVPIATNNLERFNANKDEIARFGVGHGDLFFTRSSLTPDGIAHCNIYDRNQGEDIVYDCHIIRARVDANKVDPFFVARYCSTRSARKYLVGNAKTTTMTTIDQGVISKLPVPVPPIPEQRAIATILSDMDSEITTLEARRDKTRDLKQGMMQELLTGKTRLIEN